MIIKGKSVIGLNVVTIDTGSVIETVDDIAYDPTNHRIVALLVDSGGLFSDAKAIHMDDVRNIGEDAVIVHDANVIRSIKELGEDVRSISDSSKYLVKTNVLTSDGKELGKVTDIYFDSRSGEVDSMEVSQPGLKTMTEGKKSIKPSDIVTIGADATIVSNYTEMKLEAQGEEGGLKGVLNEAKEKTAELAESAKENIQDATEEGKKKFADLQDKAADRLEDARENAKDMADDVKVKSRELADKAEDRAEEMRDVADEKLRDTKDLIDEKSAEARVKASELREEVTDKTDELVVTARVKADKLKSDSADTRSNIKAKAEELADAVEDKSREVNKAAKSKAADTKEKVADLADAAQERIEDGKETINTETRNKFDSFDHKRHQVAK